MPARSGRRALFLADTAERVGPPDAWPLVADIPVVGARIAQGQPILTVFASGSNRAAVEQALRSRLAAMEAHIDL